jgi:Putative Flp pilus-assembly TadE/G-like
MLKTIQPVFPKGPVRLGKTQYGQVLIWFLAFAASTAVIFAMVFSVGQATAEKQKVVNAADAAAYSGGLTEARALNFASYTNRAIIANEVLLAQMVSLDSWTSYFKEATKNYETEANALSAIPYVGIFFKAFALLMKTMNQIVTPIASAIDNVVPATVIGVEAFYKAMYFVTIEPAFTPPVMALAAQNAANNVLRENVATQGGRTDTAPSPTKVVDLEFRNQLEWERIQTKYKKGTSSSGGDGRRNARDLLLASNDEFTGKRSGTDVFFFDTLFGNSSACIPFVFKAGSEKIGGTRLVNYERWEAQDTVEWKLNVPAKWDCSWGKGTVAIPQGWGRAVVAQQKTSGTIQNTSGGAGSLAYSASHNTGNWSGVKDMYDIKRLASGRPTSDVELSFSVAAVKNKSIVRNNETTNFANRPMAGVLGSPDLKSGFANDQVASLSEAKVFFSRPKRNAADVTAGLLVRADNNIEYASFYNPYWQVRLKEASSLTRGYIYAAMGLDPLIMFAAQ